MSPGRIVARRSRATAAAGGSAGGRRRASAIAAAAAHMMIGSSIASTSDEVIGALRTLISSASPDSPMSVVSVSRRSKVSAIRRASRCRAAGRRASARRHRAAGSRSAARPAPGMRSGRTLRRCVPPAVRPRSPARRPGRVRAARRPGPALAAAAGRARRGNGCTAQGPPGAVADREADVGVRLLREHAADAGAGRRVAGVAVPARSSAVAERGRVADQLDRDRARAFGGRDAQPRARFRVGGARGLQRREQRDQRQRQQRGAQDQELSPGRQHAPIADDGIERQARGRCGGSAIRPSVSRACREDRANSSGTDSSTVF